MRVMSVVGARPQFVKVAPIAHAAGHSDAFDHSIVHTGQHYDPNLSEIFFRELDIPQPDVHLNIGSGSHAVQTARMLEAIEPVIVAARPDCVLVYGDTNSTLAACIAAVKLHVPVAHLEAGLRSFNREMPEEHNRILVDHAADLLLAPTQLAVANLVREGLIGRTIEVGDVMVDLLRRERERAFKGLGVAPRDLTTSTGYVVATIHRAANTDDPTRLALIVSAIQSMDVPTLLFSHPRLSARAQEFGINLKGGALRVVSPVGYREMIQTVADSRGVITDSGGLQKEAFLLGIPCTTVRQETEWPETLIDGWNILDPDLMHICELAARPTPSTPRLDHYGDGHAAERVIEALRVFA